MTWLLLAAVLALAAPAYPQGLRTYSSPDGSWSVAYPAAWEVSSSRDSRAVAFLLPAADLGGSRFRPSLVVSVSPLDPGAPEGRVLEVARVAFERAVPGARPLGQESRQTLDGGRVVLLYYYAPGQQGARPAPPLYFVVGVSARQRLYTAVGTTSPALPDYRQQAAQFRDVLVSLRARR